MEEKTENYLSIILLLIPIFILIYLNIVVFNSYLKYLFFYNNSNFFYFYLIINIILFVVLIYFINKRINKIQESYMTEEEIKAKIENKTKYAFSNVLNLFLIIIFFLIFMTLYSKFILPIIPINSYNGWYDLGFALFSGIISYFIVKFFLNSNKFQIDSNK